MLPDRAQIGALQALRLHPLFAALPTGWEAALTDVASLEVGAGGLLAEAGQPAGDLFIILQGHAKVFVPVGERSEGTVDILGPGSVLGEAAITGLGTYPASAVALDAVTAVRVPGASIRAILDTHPEVLMAMMSTMALSLRGLLNQVTELKLKSTAQRLAMYLVEMAAPGDGPAVVHLPYSKRVVAMKLGMKPETLSRAMGKLEPYGVRVDGRNSILIDDLEALCDYCGFWCEGDG